MLTMNDLGSNFFAKEEDVGKLKRSDCVIKQLDELNPYVEVKAHTGKVTEEVLKEFDVVIFTDCYDK